MKKGFSGLTSLVGMAVLLYAGYIAIRAIPELQRYIKISTM